MYDGINGICFIIIDNEQIVALFSAHYMDINDYDVIKKGHRLHVRNDYKKYFSKFYNYYFDPAFYDWFQKTGECDILMTINEGNERVLYGLGSNHY